jgi:glutathione S-transferase
MLEEMGVPYRKVAVDMAGGEHRGAEYLSINPTGQIPALRLPSGVVVGESAAIVCILGDLHPEFGLVPAIADPDRPLFLRWLLFMATSAYTAFIRSNHPERFTLDEAATEPVRQAALRDIEGHFRVLNGALEGDIYFLPRGFSALDIYLTMLTVWHPYPSESFNRLPRLGALCSAVQSRSSYSKVLAEHLPA